MQKNLLFFLLLFSSCQNTYLSVQQEAVSASFLASSWVGSPDPRQKDPPQGQNLLVSWDFPLSLFEKGLKMKLTVRLWDQTEEHFEEPILYQTDAKTFFFSRQTILTYYLEVIDQEGEVVDLWVHPLWVEKIK